MVKAMVMFGEILDSVMREQKVTNKAMAEKLEQNYGYKISKESIAKYRNSSRTPEPLLIKHISDILHISTDYLLGVDKKPVMNIPIIGVSSCGGDSMTKPISRGKTAHYNGERFNSSLYCVVACGDSMSPEIENCDEVICDPTEKPESGDMVHYRIGEEDAIKVLWEDEEANIVQLIPYVQTENFKITTIRKDDEKYNNLKMSKVVAVNKFTFNNRNSRLKLIGRT